MVDAGQGSAAVVDDAEQREAGGPRQRRRPAVVGVRPECEGGKGRIEGPVGRQPQHQRERPELANPHDRDQHVDPAKQEMGKLGGQHVIMRRILL